MAFLDCSNATVRALDAKLQLDPVSPLSAPIIGCGANNDTVMRAYVGTRCPLRDPKNNASCAWDARNQSFAGAGCVVAEETRCRCAHCVAL